MKAPYQQHASGIKLTKKGNNHDSPLKPEMSGILHENTSILSLQRINCLFHKEQNITNFCKSPECLMPLCPECVKIHTEEHTQKGSYGMYETIEEVWGSIMGEIDRLQDSYSKTKSRLQGLQHSNENAKAILLGRLGESKRRMTKIIDDFYRGLEYEINEEHSIYSKEDLVGMDFTQNKIVERLQEVEKFRKKLRGHKFLKYIIIFISSGVVPEHMNYNQEIENYISQMDSKLAFLRDDLQPNFLFNFLSQYISLENKIENRQKPMEAFRQHPQPPAQYFKEKMPIMPPQGFSYYPPEMTMPPMMDPRSPPMIDPRATQMIDPRSPMIDPRSSPMIDPQSPHSFNPMMMRDPNKMTGPLNPMVKFESPAFNYDTSIPQHYNQLPPNYENPQFLKNPTPQKNLIPSPQKPRIFGPPPQNPAVSLSEFNSPYPMSVHNSATKNSGTKETYGVRSPFKTIGNMEGLGKYNQPEPLQDPYYGRTGNQWERQ